MNKKEKIDLYRKMSLVGGFKLFGHRNIIGAKIEGSKDRSFREPILLYEFKDTLKTNYYKFVIEPADSVRYVRFVSPVDRQIELAELGFYKDTLLNEPVDTMIRINTLPLVAHESMFSNITDGDVLSYFYSRDTTCFIAYDLQKNYMIKAIRFSPRNDDNYIWPGDEYELFFQDGTNSWVSVGKQIASHDRLLHYEVPSNALFWLRDLTKGKEEQVFYMKKGKQFFTANISDEN